MGNATKDQNSRVRDVTKKCKKSKMIDFIKFLIYLVKRLDMFFIQEIDDFYFMVNGYIAGSQREEYGMFMDTFSKFLSIKYNFKEGMRYNLIIKSMSAYDKVVNFPVFQTN